MTAGPLVSPEFLASKFIMETELPALVAAEALLLPALVRPFLWQEVPSPADVPWAHDPVRDDVDDGPLDRLDNPGP